MAEELFEPRIYGRGARSPWRGGGGEPPAVSPPARNLLQLPIRRRVLTPKLSCADNFKLFKLAKSDGMSSSKPPECACYPTARLCGASKQIFVSKKQDLIDWHRSLERNLRANSAVVDAYVNWVDPTS
jgi:hypothetical protein